MARHQFQVDSRFHRRRLDELLFDRFRSLSKAYLRAVVKEGGCDVNGFEANSGEIVKKGDFVEIEIDESRETGMVPEEIPLDVLYEDSELLVVNKPAGLLVHPTNYERNGTMLNAMTFYLNRERPEVSVFIRPHLIHRLDRETSGVLIAAKDQRSSRILSSHFKRGHFRKEYIAAVEGSVDDEEGEIDLPVGRNAELKKWEVQKEGKPSVTRYKVLKRGENSTLLELVAVTGRTNQIRIHLAAIGHPIIGDELYGGREFRRMCLHASRTEFWHPNGSRRLSIDCRPDFIDDNDLLN
ncbi:MAG: RluA family pseudouridine synthase [Acidobacteriota bacterium]|nr:MAG: RluA family pseudouridine synthase [Acidobacteriota bacterium]